jgi:hypothetical protein
MPSKLSTHDDPHLPAPVRARHPCALLTGQYRICVAKDGSVDLAETVRGIADADAAILDTLRLWRFRRRESPVCAVQSFDFEVASQDKASPCTQPLFRSRDWLAQRWVSGEVVRWPATLAPPLETQTSTVVYRLCVSPEGRVNEVTPVRGLPGVDQEVHATLQKWRYKPMTLPACTLEYFHYIKGELRSWSVGSPAGRRGIMAPAVAPAAGAAKAKQIPAILIRKDKLSGVDPHLPDPVKARFRGMVVTGSYQLCISTDGVVSSVDPFQPIPEADDQIIATLLSWRYQPQAIPVCFRQFLEFHIE